MRISIGVSDPFLRRALFDLLRASGHEPVLLRGTDGGCDLHITSEPRARAPPRDCATLVLARESPPTGAGDRRAELKRAISESGTVVWASPLEPATLLAALGGEPAREDAAPAPTPDLNESPHPWLLVEPGGGRLVAANDEACGLLDIRRGDLPLAVSEVALPGALRDGLAMESQGAMALDHLGEGRWAVWWTNAAAQRVVCLMRAPGNTGAAALSSHDRSLAQIGRMTATLAHEIRNPIASVAGALDLLEAEADAEERAEILTMARQRLAEMSRLLEQTLLLARPISGSAEVVDLERVVASATSTVRLDPLFEKIDLTIEAPEQPIRVHAYPDSLLQALTNLLINAAQAQVGSGYVRISLEADGRRGFLRIQDGGPGISVEKREEIFEPFYTTKTGGAGLGLPEVRRALEAAGGAVAVEDSDEGACFRLELPLSLERSTHMG